MARKRGVSNNVYTALAFIAFLILAAGVGYTWVSLHELTGEWNPAAKATLPR